MISPNLGKFGIQDPEGKTICLDSLADTPEDAWRHFCYPSLNQDAYEEDGWKPVQVTKENAHLVRDL